MDKQTNKETPQEREKLLSQLDSRGRTLIESLLADYPEMSVAEAIEHVREMGGL